MKSNVHNKVRIFLVRFFANQPITNYCCINLISYFHFRQKQQEIVNLEAQIRNKIESQRRAGIELDSTCQICLRTKFADGIGHICNYCNVRCCAKCGGKVALRSNKVCLLAICLKHIAHKRLWSTRLLHNNIFFVTISLTKRV